MDKANINKDEMLQIGVRKKSRWCQLVCAKTRYQKHFHKETIS